MARPHVDYYQDATGEWRWTLKGANGEVVAHGEGHGSKADAERAFERTVALAADAWASTLEDDTTGEAA
jgi:uncharacterized protein YegP (UPF0339 family)